MGPCPRLLAASCGQRRHLDSFAALQSYLHKNRSPLRLANTCSVNVGRARITLSHHLTISTSAQHHKTILYRVSSHAALHQNDNNHVYRSALNKTSRSFRAHRKGGQPRKARRAHNDYVLVIHTQRPILPSATLELVHVSQKAGIRSMGHEQVAKSMSPKHRHTAVSTRSTHPCLVRP